MSQYIENIHKLKNKTVLITGCSGQLGIALCKAYTELGSKVIGVDINEPHNKIGKVSYFKLNIAKKNNIDEFFKLVKKKHESIDILVNNAGVSIFSPSKMAL